MTKCEIKMAGYWPSSFFRCLWTKTELRSINKQKKEKANIQPSWLIKLGQIIKDLFLADSSILPACVANYSAEFDSSCPFAEQAI